MVINRDTAFACQKWLLGLEDIVSAEPVMIRFGKHEFFGVLYGTKEKYLEIETAVREGIVKAGEEHINYRIYLLGVSPKKMNSEPFSKNVFTWKHDREVDARAYRPSGVWYRTCYYEAAGTPGSEMFAESHPFGNSFVLSEWREHTFGPYKGHGIDKGTNEAPHIHNEMTVEILK